MRVFKIPASRPFPLSAWRRGGQGEWPAFHACKCDSPGANVSLRRTSLYEKHVAAGAKMVDFGGFEMPLKYSSESAEHLAVRNAVGVFDAMYAGLLNERGTFVDDVIVYRFSPQKFLVCVNASNQDKDFAHIEKLAPSGVRVTNQGPQWSQLAIQGPSAVDVVAKLCGEHVRDIKGYHFAEGTANGSAAIIARTGYTGEDGFELYVKNDAAPALWDAVIAAGAVPCGLACRDTLRLEAGMCLYGNDIDEDHTPLEANLGWIVKLDGRPPFIGQDVLVKQKAEGTKRLLRGLEMVDRGIARHGYSVHDETGAQIGVVTSGTQAPFLNKAIAFAYLDKPHTELGGSVYVDVRGKKLKATVVKLPFYSRKK
jgi:aminomethyltransferase